MQVSGVSGGSRVHGFYRISRHDVQLFESFIAGRAVCDLGDLPSCAGWEQSCQNRSSPKIPFSLRETMTSVAKRRGPVSLVSLWCMSMAILKLAGCSVSLCRSLGKDYDMEYR
jgi:hypothetical protein